MNDYVFQDPVHAKTAMLQMLEQKEKESEGNKAEIDFLKIERARTQK